MGAFGKVPDRLTSLAFIPNAQRLVGAARQYPEVLQAYGLNQPLVGEAEALLARYVAAAGRPTPSCKVKPEALRGDRI